MGEPLLKLRQRVGQTLMPPPDLQIWEWGEKHFVLSTENSAQPGRWRLSKTPYLKAPLEAIKHPETEEVVLQFASQTAKSTLILLTIGYAIDQEPSPILMVQPTLELAEAFSKDRIAPMIRDSRALSELIESKSRDGSNTILHKQFDNGGQITLCGANSPSSLAMRPCRWILADEISRFPASAGTEGDPLKLAQKRSSTFYNRKHILSSTPGDASTCKIHQVMTDSVTRRYKYEIPCPHCDERILLHWSQVRWDDEQPDSAYYECQECKGEILDKHKSKFLRDGSWRCLNPEVGLYRQGYQLSALYSPWVRFGEMVREYLQARRDALRMKVFVNTYLGEPYEAESEGVDHSFLWMKREEYPKNVDVPKGGLVLTCGVDVQDDRLEAEVVAWGSDDKESWSIAYHVFWGDPSDKRTWLQLSDLLEQDFKHEWGFTMKIAATAIDSGGHHTSDVYQFVRENKLKRVFATKGMAGEGRAIVSAPMRRRTGRDKRPVDLYLVGVDPAKALLYQRLRMNEHGPGYCHFPKRDEYSQTHFKNLTAEKCYVVYRNGFPVKRWILPDGQRNEQLDCRILSMASLTILNPIFSSIEKRAIAMRDAVMARMEAGFTERPDLDRAKSTSRQAPRRNRQSYVNAWQDL